MGSKLESFLGKYKITSDHYIFGNIDMDFIGFDKNTREIILLDHDNIAFVMMECVISFLKVIKVYSEYIIHNVLTKKLPKSISIRSIRQLEDLNIKNLLTSYFIRLLNHIKKNLLTKRRRPFSFSWHLPTSFNNTSGKLI